CLVSGWGNQSQSRQITTAQVTRASSSASTRSQELLPGFGEDGGAGYSGSGGVDGDRSGRRRQRIELGCGSIAAGDHRILAGESTSCAAVVKGNADAGNRIPILVGHQHGERQGQLRSGRSCLTIAAGDGDVSGGSGNGVLDKRDVAETGGLAGDRNLGDCRRQLQRTRSQAISVGDRGRRTGNGALVRSEGYSHAGDAVVVAVPGPGDARFGKSGTGGAGLVRSAVSNDLCGRAGRCSGGGGGIAKAGPGDGQRVGANFLRKGIKDRRGIAVGVGDGGGGTERTAFAPVTEVDGGADVGLSGVRVDDLDLKGSGKLGGHGSGLGVTSGNGGGVKQSVGFETG